MGKNDVPVRWWVALCLNNVWQCVRIHEATNRIIQVIVFHCDNVVVVHTQHGARWKKYKHRRQCVKKEKNRKKSSAPAPVQPLQGGEDPHIGTTGLSTPVRQEPLVQGIT